MIRHSFWWRTSKTLPIVLAVLMASPALGADAVPCTAPNVTSPAEVSAPGAASARISFRKQGTPAWYFIDLKSGPSGFYAVLPRPKEGTVVEYQVETTDPRGNKRRFPETVAASSPSCQPVLSPDESNMASNLVIGKTDDAASDVPAGFDCSGIVGVLTTSGKLRHVICKGGILLAGTGGVPLPAAAALAASAAIFGGGILVYSNSRSGEVSTPQP